jgi:hypothetical protein
MENEGMDTPIERKQRNEEWWRCIRIFVQEIDVSDPSYDSGGRFKIQVFPKTKAKAPTRKKVTNRVLEILI